jgi:hypothetical protein
MEKIEEGLKLRGDAKYEELLKKEALENTWEKKAGEINKLVKIEK